MVLAQTIWRSGLRNSGRPRASRKDHCRLVWTGRGIKGNSTLVEVKPCVQSAVRSIAPTFAVCSPTNTSGLTAVRCRLAVVALFNFAANLRRTPPILRAPGFIQRALADHFFIGKIGDQLHFAR